MAISCRETHNQGVLSEWAAREAVVSRHGLGRAPGEGAAHQPLPISPQCPSRPSVRGIAEDRTSAVTPIHPASLPLFTEYNTGSVSVAPLHLSPRLEKVWAPSLRAPTDCRGLPPGGPLGVGGWGGRVDGGRSFHPPISVSPSTCQSSAPLAYSRVAQRHAPSQQRARGCVLEAGGT